MGISLTRMAALVYRNDAELRRPRVSPRDGCSPRQSPLRDVVVICETMLARGRRSLALATLGTFTSATSMLSR